MKKREDKEEISLLLEARRRRIRLQVHLRSQGWKTTILRRLLAAVWRSTIDINHILQLSIQEVRLTYMVVRLSAVDFIMEACSAVQEQVFKLRRHNEKWKKSVRNKIFRCSSTLLKTSSWAVIWRHSSWWTSMHTRAPSNDWRRPRQLAREIKHVEKEATLDLT